ncbi:mechanosensitive ion channel family protein [Calidithermus roseus]|uniref:Putative MscS family protein YkuT n=1 Tax=Calidithermus roseus TaxID=1644118 RepID=A0A399EP69_9DEIN|nr:mechanosensitive ion channel family protein [Calidithermus roseus]RIH85323.1 putative MscS family protein YkuT [Calidithermus roseus]
MEDIGVPGLLAELTGAPWWRWFLSLLVVVLAFWAARLGGSLLRWAGSLTPSEQDDRYWRWLGRVWWVLVGIAAFSVIVLVQGLALEPFRSWGEQFVAWLGSKGASGLLILAFSFLAYRTVSRLLGRLPVPTSEEFTRQQVRSQTLKGVLEAVLKSVVILLGGLFFLSNLGFNVTALLAGAGVVGLAVSFAAQNLIRDVLNGFFILLEDQYGVGDVVSIGQVSGGVERFNLRLTVLRDLQGRVHFIPNSQVTQVTVMSRDWARSVEDISVAYDEDVDRALEVIRDEAERLFNDPQWQEKFTQAPEVLGVERLGESGVVIRVLLSTKPKEQWAVGREFRRRIKIRFDQENIEIPFPQTKVWLEKFQS